MTRTVTAVVLAACSAVFVGCPDPGGSYDCLLGCETDIDIGPFAEIRVEPFAGGVYPLGNVAPGTRKTIVLHLYLDSRAQEPVERISLQMPLNAPFGFQGGSWPGTGGTCGSSLRPGETCTLVLSFSPVREGSYRQEFGLNYVSGRVGLHWEGRYLMGHSRNQPEALSLQPSESPYTFPPTPWGSSSRATFTLANTGSVSEALIVRTCPLDFYVEPAQPRTGGTCGEVLGAGQSCTIVVRYSPGSGPGPHWCVLAVTTPTQAPVEDARAALELMGWPQEL